MTQSERLLRPTNDPEVVATLGDVVSGWDFLRVTCGHMFSVCGRAYVAMYEGKIVRDELCEDVRQHIGRFHYHMIWPLMKPVVAYSLALPHPREKDLWEILRYGAFPREEILRRWWLYWFVRECEAIAHSPGRCERVLKAERVFMNWGEGAEAEWQDFLKWWEDYYDPKKALLEDAEKWKHKWAAFLVHFESSMCAY